MSELENKRMQLLEQIESIKQMVSVKKIKIFQIDLLERLIIRVFSFARSCEDCKQRIDNLEQMTASVANLIHKQDLDKNEKQIIIEYRKDINNIVAHLHNKHKLVSEGYYMSIYMSIGMAIGVALGTAFGNIALGIPIGLSIGMAIGVGMDSDAKKKGLVI